MLPDAPGTGISRLAECVAGHAGAAFINVSAPGMQEKYVGDAEKIFSNYSPWQTSMTHSMVPS